MPSAWLECFLSLYFDLDLGPVVESCHPPGALTPQGEQSVLHHAFPDCNPDVEHNFIFFFNLEDTSITQAAAHHASCEELQVLSTAAPSLQTVNSSMLYGASYYRQKKDPRVTRGFVQQVFVVLSRLPYYNLLETILRVVEPKCAQCCARSPDLTVAAVASPFAPYPAATDHPSRARGGSGADPDGKNHTSAASGGGGGGGGPKRRTTGAAAVAPLLDPSYNPLYYTQQQVLQEAYDEIAHHWPTPHPRARYSCWLLREQIQFATPAALRRRWLPPPTLFSQRPPMDLKESSTYSGGAEGQHNSVYLIPYHGGGGGGGGGGGSLRRSSTPLLTDPTPPSSPFATYASPSGGGGATSPAPGASRSSSGREMEALPLFQIFQEQIPYLTRVWELLLHHESLFILSNTPAAASAASLGVLALLAPIRYNGYLKAYFTVQNSDYGRYTRLGALIPFQRHKSTVVAVTNPFFIKHFAGWKHCLVVLDAATIPQPSGSAADAAAAAGTNNNNNNNSQNASSSEAGTSAHNNTSVGLLHTPASSSYNTTTVNSMRSLGALSPPLPSNTAATAAAAAATAQGSSGTGGLASFLANAASSIGIGGDATAAATTTTPTTSASGSGPSPSSSSLQKYADFSRVLQNAAAAARAGKNGDDNSNTNAEGNSKGFDVDSALLNTKKTYVFQQSSSSSSSCSSGGGSDDDEREAAPSQQRSTNSNNNNNKNSNREGVVETRQDTESPAPPPLPPSVIASSTLPHTINNNNNNNMAATTHHHDPALPPAQAPPPAALKPTITTTSDYYHHVRPFTAADFAQLKTKCKDKTKYYTNQNEEINSEVASSGSKNAAPTAGSAKKGAPSMPSSPGPSATNRNTSQQKYKVSAARAKLQHQLKSYLDTTFTNAYSNTSVTAILGGVHGSAAAGVGEAAAAAYHHASAPPAAATAAAAAAAATKQAQHEAASEYFFINHEEQTKLLVKRLETVSRLGGLSQQLTVQQHYDDWFGGLQQQQQQRSSPLSSPPPPPQEEGAEARPPQRPSPPPPPSPHAVLRCSPDFLFTSYTVADDIVHKYFASLTMEFLSPVTAWYKHVVQHSFKYTPVSLMNPHHHTGINTMLPTSSSNSNKNNKNNNNNTNTNTTNSNSSGASPSDYLLVFQLCDKNTIDSVLSPEAFLSFLEVHHRAIAPLLVTKYHPYKSYRYLYEVFARGSLFLSYVYQLVEDTLREAFLDFDLTRILAHDVESKGIATAARRRGEAEEEEEEEEEQEEDAGDGKHAPAGSGAPPKPKPAKKIKIKTTTARRLLVPAETEVIDCFITIYHYIEREVEVALDPDVLFVRAATAVLASLAAALEQPLLREQFMWKIESLKI